MAAFHQLNLYNTQDRQDQGLHSALHPSDFICVLTVNQSGLDQGKDVCSLTAFTLSSCFPITSLSLINSLPSTTLLFPPLWTTFTLTAVQLPSPGHMLRIIAQARSCVQNWPMPVKFLKTDNLQDSVSAASESCFRLHLGSATLVAGPRPTNTSEYSLTAIWEQYYREMH